MKILVTGGAGYIGSHAVYELIDEGYEVVIVDNLSTGFDSNVHPNATFYKFDLKNENDLKQVFIKEKNIEAIMHFAGSIIVSESVRKPLEYFDNNASSLVSLLRMASEFNIKYFIFSSTAAVYGNPEKTPICEDDIKAPINPYGESKLAAENLIKSWALSSNSYYVIFRYFNVAGANKNKQIGIKSEKLTHLIPAIIDAALTGDEIKIFGDDYPTKDGTCIRDYVHVVDIAKAHIMGLEYSILNRKSDIFNLGSMSGYSVLQVLNEVKKILNVDVKYKIVNRRDGDPAVLLADVKKVQSILKWKAQKTLSSIVESEYEFRKINIKK